MKILARYVHGSADSTDCDVLYIIDKIPDPAQCPMFCNGDPAENRNIAVIEDGNVVWCYKGFPDEVNNAVLTTYPLHDQEDELLIKGPVDRDLPLKLLSVLRKLIMDLRHTDIKREARAALKKGYNEKIDLLESTDLRIPVWDISEQKQLEMRKGMAFQLGQVLALNAGIEVYTKGRIAEYSPALRPYLSREPCPMDALEGAKKEFLQVIRSKGFTDIGDNVVSIGKNPERIISLKGKEHDVDGVI